MKIFLPLSNFNDTQDLFLKTPDNGCKKVLFLFYLRIRKCSINCKNGVKKQCSLFRSVNFISTTSIFLCRRQCASVIYETSSEKNNDKNLFRMFFSQNAILYFTQRWKLKMFFFGHIYFFHNFCFYNDDNIDKKVSLVSVIL